MLLPPNVRELAYCLFSGTFLVAMKKEPTWRVGNKLGRTLYKNDECVGMADTPELAQELVDAANGTSQPLLDAAAAAEAYIRTNENYDPDDTVTSSLENMSAYERMAQAVARWRNGPGPSYVVALIQKDGKVVACTRRNRPGDLGLPGGSIEPTDRSPFDALAREVMEETGIVVLDAEHVFSRIDHTDGNVAWAYVVTKWEGAPKTCEPGIEVTWEDPDRLLLEGNTFREYNTRLFEKLGIR
jgi:8-oxo-dGTP pyrophosphatase MutT (NUDIX family)